jgi:DNA-binding transcriptional LysR family regulator
MISTANQLEFRQLNYFKVLAQELHYRKASELLFISQSALSQQIKQLENILKVPLFERTNKKVLLTEAGALFYKDVLLVMNRVEHAVNNLKLYKDGNTGQLRIGFVASAMESVLPALLKQFNTDCPNIKFQLDELSNADQLTELQNERLDIGFMRSNHVPDGFTSQQVGTETFSVVLPANHPINKKNFRDVGQFMDEYFILFPNEQSQLYYQQIINLCADRGFVPKVAHRSIHTPTIFRLVENGMGISIIPTSLAASENPNIKFIELKNIPQRTALYVVWKVDNSNPALPYLLEMLPGK